MSPLVVYNGNIFKEEDVRITINNRSFRYGDGCFETIKIINGRIVLPDLHFSRLFSSLATLQFNMPPSFNATYFTDHILQLTNQNKHLGLARVRLTIFRGEGSLSDEVNHTPHFIIQSWAGKPESNSYNPDGLTADFYLDFKKNGDHFSGIKSNNYLGYAMAAFHARSKNLDDCVISNCYGRLVESTIANVFIVTNGVIKTPALTEGCIAGVMRRHLLNCCIKENLPFKEAAIPTDEVTEASEVFLTNALYGIRWVKKIGNSNYTNDMSALLHQKFIVPLFNV